MPHTGVKSCVKACRSPTLTCSISGLSVEKGDAGSPSLLNNEAAGTFDHPYRTRVGFAIDGLLTITVSPLMIAFPQTKEPEAAAMANPEEKMVAFTCLAADTWIQKVLRAGL